MSKEDVFNYVMNSPENTNPAVLKSLLNGVGGGGSSEVFAIDFYTDPDYGTQELATSAEGIANALLSNKTLVLNHDYTGQSGFAGYKGIPLNSYEPHPGGNYTLHFFGGGSKTIEFYDIYMFYDEETEEWGSEMTWTRGSFY